MPSYSDPKWSEMPLMRLMGGIMRRHRHLSHLMLKDQDVHPGQPPVLFELARHDGMRQSELAERIRITPATLTVMLNRMVKNGHVERRTDPDDQRVSRVYLTDKGRDAVEEVREALHASEALVLEGISPAENMLLRRLFMHMYQNLDKYEEIISRQNNGEEPPDGPEQQD